MALRALKTRRVHVLAEVLAQLAAGKAPYEIEHRMIKIMEEPNRRNPQGQVLPASPHIQAAASYLANELACSV